MNITLQDLLAFATRIIPIGRVFSKRLYKAIGGFKSPYHFLRITKLVSDLLVWDEFLASYNGCSFWQTPFCDASAISLFTDAGGSIGYGVFWQGRWSMDFWPTSWIEKGLTKNIVLLEIFPIFGSPRALG